MGGFKSKKESIKVWITVSYNLRDLFYVIYKLKW